MGSRKRYRHISKWPKPNKGKSIGSWNLQQILGQGGNGTVWSATDKNNNRVAIKLLHKANPKAYQRFVAEMIAVEKNADVPGILPIYDKFLPTENVRVSPYYVMPVAQPMRKRWSGASVEDRVRDLFLLAQTLAILHERSIAHRDIKPGNILYWNNRVCIADFGLVEYPEKPQISSTHEEIGAKWTMAPEMRRKAAISDPFKADVYSFGKLIWMVITGDEKGFEGQYLSDSSLGIQRLYPNYLNPIEQIITRCTQHDPDKRPGMGEVMAAIEKWELINQNFHHRNLLQWNDLQSKLFPATVPATVIWTSLEDIVSVLQSICSMHNLNHVLFPDHGGLDLIAVVVAGEKGCIELDFGHVEIVKPKRLIFESFDQGPEWSYFRLELEPLKRCIVIDSEHFDEEQEDPQLQTVSELAPGVYYPKELLIRYSMHSRNYDIPPSARLVTRRFQGAFVIVPKRSIYNSLPESYDAGHNRVTADQFRLSIVGIINSYNKLKGLPPKASTNDKPLVHRNFFIEKQVVQRCGWCGRLLTEQLNDPTDAEYNYLIKVITKYGEEVIRSVTGKCCRDKYEDGQSQTGHSHRNPLKS